MIRKMWRDWCKAYREVLRERAFDQGYKYADRVVRESKGDRYVARELYDEASEVREHGEPPLKDWEHAYNSGVKTRLQRMRLLGD